MSNNEIYKGIYNRANDYLLTFEGVTQKVIERQLDEWKKNKPGSIEELQIKMIEAARERQMMPNVIGDIKKLEPYLEGFNPVKICEKYEGDWKSLLSKLDRNLDSSRNMDINNPRNLWVIFCKSVISSSDFLSQFSSLEDFYKFIDQFHLNEYTRVALPLLLEKEISGFGFPLACDFLLKIGLNNFVKPDVHIKEIFYGIGISKSKTDYVVFKDLIRFSESIDELPCRVDKLFWLIGSGKFYLEEPPFRVKTNRNQFIKQIKNDFYEELNKIRC